MIEKREAGENGTWKMEILERVLYVSKWRPGKGRLKKKNDNNIKNWNTSEIKKFFFLKRPESELF